MMTAATVQPLFGPAFVGESNRSCDRSKGPDEVFRGILGTSPLGRVASLGQDGRLADVAPCRFDASTEPP